MLRYNFVALELIALILAIIAISTCSWQKATLYDVDAVQAVRYSPLLTTLVLYDDINMDFRNSTGYVLKINTGLMEICARIQQPHNYAFGPERCKRAMVRPAIGLAIVGVLFLTSGTVCTGLADKENGRDREARWLSYCSAILVALGGLLLFTSHWTYEMSSELQLSKAYIQYGSSTYLIVTAAVTSLLSMSLVLWRIYLRRVYCVHRPKTSFVKRRTSSKLNRRL